MNTNLYHIDGKIAKQIVLPEIFQKSFRVDLVRRAILAEQSLRYQPQAHYISAGMQTSAMYIGEYSTWRTGRHMGTAIRPRQKLAGGAQGEVRKIPSAKKGRRAHPHVVEKIIAERINAQEYRRALESAIAGTSNQELMAQRHAARLQSAPIVMEDKIEGVSKSKELIKILGVLGLKEDLEKSHDPRLRKGLRRSSRIRSFRKTVLIIAKDTSKVEKAGRNIPGVDVRGVESLSVESLAPGAIPRITIWSEAALSTVQEAVKKAKL
ncbi:MAG: 50S ribosomal protein L4 [Candidatus Micrarchaeota archaeon]|nr:50S ribosomal protein L4 [Candidatus Micrarchaeota archaeon]MDE1847665.1 50S ribosomal protein L4 [Candidatus Micrarchaeota archaeon]MDE1864486.1 50S ribosomal protein L4 [Candidatus Micrarchaeota archaeon]